MELCTFTPTRQGDYYLHVRTNKRFDFTGSALMRSVTSGSLSGITGQAGDSSPYGGGSNSFSIRAVTPAGIERQVAVSGYDRMPIYVNSEAADTEFNLIRILPGAAGQFISFDFFDAGDATGEATVQVLLPADATKNDGTPITDKFPTRCRSYGGSAGGSAASPGQTSATCTFTLTRSGSTSRNNGKVQTITIPIPTDYKCDATDFVKCWYKVKDRLHQRFRARRDHVGRRDRRRPGPADRVEDGRVSLGGRPGPAPGRAARGTGRRR